MTAPSRKLTLQDIEDQRAYERTRDTYRTTMIDVRNKRRVHLGTIISVSFESRETIRFQIQEMARVERITTDEGIQEELDAYNPLIPEPGQLCATLFLELTSDESLREWLPKLVGIERSVLLRLPNGEEVRCSVDPQHASQLTREEATAAVHYIFWDLSPAQVEAFGPGTVLAVDHPAYREETALAPATIEELTADLRGR
jgi:hypothetical protein